MTKLCTICEGTGGVLSPRGAHFICEILKRNDKPTPKMDDIKEASGPGFFGARPARGGTYSGPLIR